MQKKQITVYVDIDGVLADFDNAIKEYRIKEPSIEYPQSQYGFYSKLKPIKDSLEGFRFLEKFFDTYILTAPSVKNPFSYLEKRVWVENYLGLSAAERMIISNNKHLLKGHYLIDDNLSGNGQNLFDGHLLHFNESFNWIHIMEYFHNKYINITNI